MKSTLLFCALLFLTLYGPGCRAQQKYEREYSIKAASVPEKASQFIREIYTGKRIHWYGEESLTGTTVEAKFKYASKRYSIEFDTLGEVQDVEVLGRFNAIPAETRKVMGDNLDKEFQKYKVVKTQTQWTGSESALKKAMSPDKIPPSVETRYELILKGTRNNTAAYYEVLFESSGKIKSMSEIVQQNTNNLIY